MSANEHSASGNPPENLLALWRRIGRIWLTYIKGQLLIALITGGAVWALNAAIGLHWALPLGCLAGLLNTVPSIGPLIAIVPAAIVAVWKGSSVLPVNRWLFGLIVIGAYLLFQQISALFIEPWITGKRLRLPALVVLLSVFIGALVGNIIGALIAVPVVASLREIAIFTLQRIKRLRQGRRLPPPEETAILPSENKEEGGP